MIPIYAGFILNGVVTTMLGSMLPQLSARWSLDEAHAGRLFSAQFIGSLIGTLFASRLILRAGAPRTIAMGLLAVAGGTVALLFAPWPALLIAVFVYGAGIGLMTPATNLLIASLSPGHRAAALNRLNFIWCFGAVIAPVLVAVLGIPALLLSVVVCAIASAVGIARARIATAPVEAAGAPGVHPLRSGISWEAALFLFLYVGIEVALSGWLPSHAGRVAGATWIANTCFWGTILAGRLIAPLALRRISDSALVLYAIVVAVCGIAAVAVSSNLATFAIATIVAGFGLSAIFPTRVAIFTEQAGADASRFASFVFGMSTLGGALLPWLTGIAATVSSLRVALVVPLAAAVILVPLSWHLRVLCEEQRLLTRAAR